ncbi:MAG: AMP-binding protein, partial [Paludibacteraceae bacterium]|nr:AMP-binding protein [Paludibacteraceae bacterium]
IGRTPSPKILLQAFAEVRPNLVLTVPLVIEKIYKQQILPLISKPSMRWALRIPLLDQAVLSTIRERLVQAFGGRFREVIIGGAALNAEVEDFFHKINFPYVVGYGMTECAPLISHARYGRFKPFSVGRILPCMEVRIEPVPNVGEGVGEILVRGENVMNGYYKNPEATAQAFEADGWMHTGDLGTVDDEGNIYIRGRNKTMLLGPSGQNIYPEEIEAKLNNMPYVMESIVLQQEGKLVALVCPDYAAIDADKLDSEQVVQRMEENKKELNKMLAAYENITKIILYPNEFEKTPKKSIKRYLYTAQTTA